MRNLLLLATATSFACIPIGEYDEEFTNSDVQYEDNFEQEVVVTVNWNNSGVVLEVENSDPNGRYSFGLAENSGSCLDSEWGCWTGEDCYMGFDLTSGGNLTYCHPVYGGTREVHRGQLGLLPNLPEALLDAIHRQPPPAHVAEDRTLPIRPAEEVFEHVLHPGGHRD